MKSIIYILSACTLLGCGRPKFFSYTEKKAVAGEEVVYTNTDFNREILQIFSSISENPDHIIYLFVPSNDFSTQSFQGMIYDVDHQKYYKINNASGKLGETVLSEVITFERSDYCQFIISTYINDENYLRWLIDNDMAGGPIATNVLYDINSKKKILKRFFFGGLFFIEGMPYLELKEGKEMLEFRKIPPYKPKN